MIKYENGAIIVSKDSALEELRKFAIDFGEMVLDKNDEEDPDHKTLDVEFGIDCVQVAVYFTFGDNDGIHGDICYYDEDCDDKAKEYKLSLADEEEMLDTFDGDLGKAMDFVKENLERFFEK